MNDRSTRIFRDLPRSWVERLFGATLSGQTDVLWRAVAAILLEALPEDLFVVWETFQSTLYRRGPDGRAMVGDMAAAFALRGPQIYTALNCRFEQGVRGFTDSGLAKADVATHALLAPLRPLHAMSMDFVRADQAHATLILYGRDAASTARRTIFEQLRPILQRCFDRLFETERRVAAGTGLAEFLRELPVGLVLVDWFGTVLTVNDEACRQAALWNAGSEAADVKNARANFVIPDALLQGWGTLRAQWIDWLNGKGARPVEATITHDRDPRLRAIASLILHEGAPAATPCFMSRFIGLHTRSAIDHATPSLQQIALLSQLSPAERKVAMLVREGLSNREIAQRLGRQVGTVKDHLTSIYNRTGTVRRAHLLSILLK